MPGSSAFRGCSEMTPATYQCNRAPEREAEGLGHRQCISGGCCLPASGRGVVRSGTADNGDVTCHLYTGLTQRIRGQGFRPNQLLFIIKSIEEGANGAAGDWLSLGACRHDAMLRQKSVLSASPP